MEFYDEYIADAGFTTRKEIEEQLGTPRQLSHKVLADYSIRVNNESTRQGNQHLLILVGESSGGCYLQLLHHH